MMEHFGQESGATIPCGHGRWQYTAAEAATSPSSRHALKNPMLVWRPLSEVRRQAHRRPWDPNGTGELFEVVVAELDPGVMLNVNGRFQSTPQSSQVIFFFVNRNVLCP